MGLCRSMFLSHRNQVRLCGHMPGPGSPVPVSHRHLTVRRRSHLVLSEAPAIDTRPAPSVQIARVPPSASLGEGSRSGCLSTSCSAVYSTTERGGGSGIVQRLIGPSRWSGARSRGQSRRWPQPRISFAFASLVRLLLDNTAHRKHHQFAGDGCWLT